MPSTAHGALAATGDLLAGWGFGDLLSFLIVDGAQLYKSESPRYLSLKKGGCG